MRTGLMAELHPQLRKDCLVVGRFGLCHLLLMRDANYPWFILVPDRESVTEIHQLDELDQDRLIRESSCLARILKDEFGADKINIAALGNMVPQLHVHHVARYRDDPAWPHPVWGRLPARPYDDDGIRIVMDRLRTALPGDFRFSG